MLMLCPCLIFAGREFQVLTPLNIIDCCVIDLEKKGRCIGGQVNAKR